MNKTLHYIIILMALACCLGAQAQWQNGLWVEKQAYNWYFGLNAGLNFETFPPTALSDGQIGTVSMLNSSNGNLVYDQDPSASSISDAEGNLLFYTDGNTVWSSNHEIMDNGTDLICLTPLMQATIIIKAPGDNQIYYIFGIKSEAYYTHVYPISFGLEDPYNTPLVVYSEVDMSLNNGLGAVTENKNVVIADFDEPAYGRVTATHHADGNQIWVMFHSLYNSEFKAFLVSENGVNPEPVISERGFSENEYPDAVCQMKFSPDGTKLAKSYQTVTNMKMEIFGFDKSTGKVNSILATLDDFDFAEDGEIFGVQGMEFSPNSRFLYISLTLSGVVKQYDTEAGSEAEIKASAVNLFVPANDGEVYSTFMQVAPDGKIYVPYGMFAFGGFTSVMDHTTMNVINYPNNKGMSAGFEVDAIDLVTGESGMSLPTFTQSYFASGILSEGDCANDVSFSTIRIPGIESITWDFGDPASGENNTSTELEPVHSFSSGGTYTVTATITSNGAEQTASTTITVLPFPDAVVPAADNLSKCADSTGYAVFDLTDFDATILNGQSTAEYTIGYYISPEDVEAGNVIDAPAEFLTGGQVIYAVVTNITTGCKSMIELDLVVNPLPVADPATIEECGDASAIGVFNLTQQTSAMLVGQDPAGFNVVYYTDEGLTNEILQPEAFESAGQTIFATVTNVVTGCSISVQFDINVIQPALPGLDTFIGCSPFDLYIVAGEPEDGTVFSFYTSEEDAVGNINAITNPDEYIVIGNTGSVFIRAINNSGCVRVGELFLEAGDCFIPRGISPNNDGLNDTFDLSGFDVKYIAIFNRYGQEVYTRNNYINEWSGQSSDGSELPSGTYFYMIETGEGKSKTGWVYINRQE